MNDMKTSVRGRGGGRAHGGISSVRRDSRNGNETSYICMQLHLRRSSWTDGHKILGRDVYGEQSVYITMEAVRVASMEVYNFHGSL